MNAETRGASSAALRHHYDLSNEFYGLWLDRSMTYSCALYAPGDDLERAQVRKIEHHITEARARGAERVLDIGCGWGATMLELVRGAGVGRAVGLTLSHAQAEHIRAIAEPAVEVRVESWEHHEPSAPYGAIISVGAFEHFARPSMSPEEMTAAYARFFARCHAWLAPGGHVSLQTIAYGTARRAQINPFILEHIFPESDLPTLEVMLPALSPYFELVRLRNDREHYTETFRAWAASLDARRDQAEALVGKEVVARYRRYHGLFTIGFHTGAMQLLRLTLRRRDDVAVATFDGDPGREA